MTDPATGMQSTARPIDARNLVGRVTQRALALLEVFNG
jgi:hypothetical protein